MSTVRSLLALIFALVMVIAPTAPAEAALTEAQIQSILSLLSSFGADSTTVTNVNLALRGEATTGTPPRACPALIRELTLGSRGDDVKSLQAYLAQEGYFSESATGYFGFVTAEAVGRLQLKLGVVSSSGDEAYGIVGPKTRAAIARVCAGITSGIQEYNPSPLPPPPPPPLSGISCSIWSDKKSYTLGEKILFSWTSTNATYAAFIPDTSGKDNLKVPGDKLPTRGTQEIIASGVGQPYVTLAVYDAQGQSASCKATVLVDYGVSTMSFSASPSSGSAPLKVEFYGTNLPAGSLQLEFGDGTRSLTTALCLNKARNCTETPGGASHIYSVPGTYLARLWSTTGCIPGSDVPCRSDSPLATVLGAATINVTGTVSTGLSAYPTLGTAPLFVSFTGMRWGLGTNYVDFGNGATASVKCAEFKPDTDACLRIDPITHTYTNAGTYTAKQYFGSSVVASASVTVKSSTSGVTINSFTATPSAIKIGESSVLSWAASGITDGGCYLFEGSGSATITAGNNWGSVGSHKVYPAVTTAYTLSCHQSWKDGSPQAKKTLTVTVGEVSCPTPASSNMGVYKLYSTGSSGPSTSVTCSISQADALANCQLNANNNPTHTTKCTWNGVEIFNNGYPSTVTY